MYCRFAVRLTSSGAPSGCANVYEEKVARREADVELRQQTAARLAEKVGPHWTLRRCRIQRSWALRL